MVERCDCPICLNVGELSCPACLADGCDKCNEGYVLCLYCFGFSRLMHSERELGLSDSESRLQSLLEEYFLPEF